MVNTDEADHCTKDALTSFLGYMLQAVLAGLAFTCLIGTHSHNLHLMLMLLLDVVRCSFFSRSSILISLISLPLYMLLEYTNSLRK